MTFIMKKLFQHISLTSSSVALVAILLAGCAADNNEVPTDDAAQKLDIMPMVNDLNKSTRADADPLHEKALSTLDFKLFDNEQSNNIDEHFPDIAEGKEQQVGGSNWKSEFKLDNRTYNYYAVANAKACLKGKNAALAKTATQEDDDIWQTYSDGNKKLFLMSSMGQYTVTTDLNQTIPFELVRAAAKIQLNLETKVPGYKATSLKWKLINYNTNTSVFDGQTAESKIVKDDKSEPSNEVETLADQKYAVTTYSYATSWTLDEEAPQILVTIHFAPEVEAQEKEIVKTYNIPVRNPEDKDKRLERNHIYKINATLKNLGTSSEIHYGTPDIMTYAITKWSYGGTTKVNEGQASYLIVDPTFLVMKNINADATSIKFFGSDFCHTKDLHAWYINKDGVKATDNVQSGNAIINDGLKRGCVRVESEAYKITVKYSAFTIYCGDPSKGNYNEKKVLVKRYPLDFVEYVDGSFVIQTTNTNHDFTIARPSSSSSDKENIVSPAFAIAKQQYKASNLESALHESQKGSKMKNYEGWRLPTNEELKLIKSYQDNGNYQSNISKVLNGTYWTLSGKQYDASSNNLSDGNGEAQVLCVHDLTAEEIKALEEEGKESVNE